jgi:hypothetical protein
MFWKYSSDPCRTLWTYWKTQNGKLGTVLLPIIPATWEAEIRRIEVWGQTPISKITRAKWTGGVAQQYSACFQASVPPKTNKWTWNCTFFRVNLTACELDLNKAVIYKKQNKTQTGLWANRASVWHGSFPKGAAGRGSRSQARKNGEQYTDYKLRFGILRVMASTPTCTSYELWNIGKLTQLLLSSHL